MDAPEPLARVRRDLDPLARAALDDLRATIAAIAVAIAVAVVVTFAFATAFALASRLTRLARF